VAIALVLILDEASDVDPATDVWSPPRSPASARAGR
jgi:hypothetical protein